MHSRIALGCVVLLLAGATARAEWLEASSDHFVIYGRQSEQTMRAYAERLERFHAGMSVILKQPLTKPSPSNRVTIFVVGDRGDVRQVAGSTVRGLTGIYYPRAGASVAIVPRLTTTSSDIAPAGQTVLFHEYAHHVMEGVSERAYPRWFVEGFAEYFSETRFMPDGSLGFGVPATDRVKELAYVGAVPMRRLLDLDGGGVAQKPAYGSFYATSWALFHYLQTDASRVGQLRDYERRLANGEPPLAAAEGAFGDLDALGRDMLAYVNKGLMMMIVVDRKALPVGVIQVRRLRPGEAAMMPVVIESKVGVDREEALALLPEARKVAMQFADDSAVLAALAEAEHDAGNDEEAIAAADKALGLDPRQINAHIQKGYALTRKAQDGEQPEAAWKVARSQWVKANKAENDHPVPLVQFYLSFVDQGERPTPTAVQGLEWALQLAPFDPNLRWRVVQQMIQDERYAEAAGVLSPLAYSPHPGEFTDRARTLLQEVEAKAGGDSSSVPAPVTVD